MDALSAAHKALGALIASSPPAVAAAIKHMLAPYFRAIGEHEVAAGLDGKD
jgi:hypothetical protein